MSLSDQNLLSLLEAARSVEGLLRAQMRPAQAGVSPLPWQRLPAVEALTELQDEERAQVIGALLQDRSPVLRSLGVFLIVDGEHEGWLPAAMRSLSGAADELLATWLVVAVGRLGARRYLAFVDAALDAPATFWAAVEALSLLGGEEAGRSLERAAARFEDTWDKLDVLMVIARQGGDFANPLLRRMLVDASEPSAVRGFAAQALGARRDREALDALVEALADETMSEKGRVLWALGALGEASAFDAVLPWVTHAGKDWWRGEALKALAAMDPERARGVVAEVATEGAFFRDDPQRFADVVQALGTVGGDEALSMLADTLWLWSGATSGDSATNNDPGTALPGRRGFVAPDALVGAGERLGVILLDAVGEALGVGLGGARGGLTPAQVLSTQALALLEALRAASTLHPSRLEEALVVVARQAAARTTLRTDAHRRT